MFGHPSIPTVVYSFGAKPPPEQPVRDQMYLAHKYRNALIEIERSRRLAVRVAVSEHAPAIAASDAQLATLAEELERVYGQIGTANSAARSRKAAPSAHRERAKAIRAEMKSLRQSSREARAEVYADPVMKEKIAAIDAAHQAKVRAARAVSEVYFGTYLATESAARQARVAKGMPQFVRWGGDGKAGAQIQGGCSLDEALAGTDTRLKIELLDGRRKPSARISVRVDSDERGKPIWATSIVRWHREIPRDAQIKWAYMVRRRVGLSEHWSVQLTVSRTSGFGKTDHAESGTVTVRRLWTLMADGGIRVAEWSGDDGRSGVLVLAGERVSALRDADGIQQVRSDRLALGIGALRAWLAAESMPVAIQGDADYLRERIIGREESSARRVLEARLDSAREIISGWPTAPPAISDLFREQIKYIHSWKSDERLSKLVLWWRDNRFAGDETAYEYFEQWRRHQKHLRNYEAHRRRRFANWRREQYRLFAVMLRRSYAECVVTKLDVKQMARRLAPENPDPMIKAVRYNQRLASPGMLGQVLAELGPASAHAEVVTQ